jgi:hypothetical protein
MALRTNVRHEHVPRKVLAFYYPWYGNAAVEGGSGRASHWGMIDEARRDVSDSTHYPSLGPYDSYDPSLIRRHCQWAVEAGLDGFIASWWGHASFEDGAMTRLLESCQESGLELTVYYEAVPEPKNPSSAAADILRLLRRYAHHPAWMRQANRPVLFVYSRAVNELGLSGWLQVIDEVNRDWPGGAVFLGDRLEGAALRVFDGIHTYNTADQLAGKSAEQCRTWAAAVFPTWVAPATLAGRISTLTLIPGYDDTKIRRPGLRVERSDSHLYRVQWEEALSALPDWILITSFNEWHEGSELEPSDEYGDAYLELTRQFVDQFKAKAKVDRPAGTAMVPAEHKRALAESLAGRRIGVLPGFESPAVWTLLEAGLPLEALGWDQTLALPERSTQAMPCVIYASGESYRQTVSTKGDVDRALHSYIRSGGTLLVLPTEPTPFFYDERRQLSDSWRRLGLPLAIGNDDGGWERPPGGQLTFSPVGDLPHVPPRIPFPSQGDLRWRPAVDSQLAKGWRQRPILELEDDRGNPLGYGASEIRPGDSEANGRLIYVWFRLLDGPAAEGLVLDLIELASQRPRSE